MHVVVHIYEWSGHLCMHDHGTYVYIHMFGGCCQNGKPVVLSAVYYQWPVIMYILVPVQIHSI